MLPSTETGLMLSQIECKKANAGGTETVNASVLLKGNEIYLCAKITSTGKKIDKSEGGNDHVVMCQMAYSTDGKKFQRFGNSFQVKEGKWIGAKIGMFCTRPAIVSNDGGWADIDWFRIEKQVG